MAFAIFSGWLIGKGIGILIAKRKAKTVIVDPSGNGSVMDSRMQAIKKAIEENKTEYEFTVSSPLPMGPQ